MSGLIIGAQGLQRSGKTMIMYRIAKQIHDATGIPVYTNLVTNENNWHFINSITEIPFNFKPKIALIDEIYNGADAQNWKKLSEVSIFVNTIGKQNILFLYTTIDFNMVFNRIRTQNRYSILVKADEKNIYYRVIDPQSMNKSDYKVQKNQQLFSSLNYDHEYVPLGFDWNMKEFQKKLVKYYEHQYPQLAKYIKADED